MKDLATVQTAFLCMFFLLGVMAGLTIGLNAGEAQEEEDPRTAELVTNIEFGRVYRFHDDEYNADCWVVTKSGRGYSITCEHRP